MFRTNRHLLSLFLVVTLAGGVEAAGWKADLDAADQALVRGDLVASRAAWLRAHGGLRTPGLEHEPLARTGEMLAKYLLQGGDLEAAREVAERSLALREAVSGPASPRTKASLQVLEFVASATNDAALAAEVSTRKGALPAPPPVHRPPSPAPPAPAKPRRRIRSAFEIFPAMRELEPSLNEFRKWVVRTRKRTRFGRLGVEELDRLDAELERRGQTWVQMRVLVLEVYADLGENMRMWKIGASRRDRKMFLRILRAQEAVRKEMDRVLRAIDARREHLGEEALPAGSTERNRNR